eukprot:CAMPEP_0179339812 /NCGR_PEP_ID=MMETSP0797-20121207/68927_1 /TAXON_ID=47934 /ORGANISM="Dinophysis acuminata, Strain DAEP01" /LENGTH=194 /DNA_ID=CAMNT_0021053693 /DNA_START=188 /DNA_END=773 /DNA_ORIENTATION=-
MNSRRYRRRKEYQQRVRSSFVTAGPRCIFHAPARQLMGLDKTKIVVNESVVVKGYGYTAAGLHHVATDRALESPSSSQAPGQQQASRALHRDPVPAEAEDAGGRLEVAAYPAEISLSRVEVATCRRQGAATAPLRQHRLDLHHLGGVRRQLEWDVFLSSLRGQEPPARTWLPGSMDRFRWEAVVRQAEERVVST